MNNTKVLFELIVIHTPELIGTVLGEFLRSFVKFVYYLPDYA